MAGSNWFSDLLKPVSDFIESIPIVGDVVEYADKLALNTDPFQLGTAAIGKMIGGDTEEYYTSEEARKGASHNIGVAALAYLLGGGAGAGAEGGTGAGAVPAGETGVGNAATYGITTESCGTLASGAGGGSAATTTSGGATLMSQILGGGSVPEGAAGYGSATTYGAGGITQAGQASTMSNLLSNKLLMQYLSNMGKDLANYGGNTDKGMQFTNTNATTMESIRANNYAALMKQLLGPEDENKAVVNKDLSLKDSTLYKSILGMGSIFKAAPQKTDPLKTDFSFKPEDNQKSYDVANPFKF